MSGLTIALAGGAETTGTVDGEAVAAEVGRSPDDAEVYWAFQEIRRRAFSNSMRGVAAWGSRRS